MKQLAVRALSRLCGLASETTRPERQDHKQHAEDDGIGRDQPKHGECTCSRLRHEENAQHDRGKSREDEQPLTLDLFSQADRGHDLENACADRLDRDIEQDCERSETGGKESQDPDADSKQPPEKQHPPMLVILACRDRRPDTKDAVRH